MKRDANKKSPGISVKYLLYDFIKLTAVTGYLWFRPKRYFSSKAAKKHIKGGSLLISNHVGFSDPVVLMLVIWYRRHHFICIKDFFEGKWRHLFRFFQCIPIDRENFGPATFRTIVDHLKKEELVSMFPEGHVNTDTEQGMNPFKSGMVLMSVMSGKPIVPVYLKKREHWYSRARVAIGEPIDIVAMYGARPSMTQIEEAAVMLRQREEELEQLIIGGKKHADTK